MQLWRTGREGSDNHEDDQSEAIRATRFDSFVSSKREREAKDAARKLITMMAEDEGQDEDARMRKMACTCVKDEDK